MTNVEIVEKYLKNGLIDKCLDHQFAKIRDKQFKQDLKHDLIIELLEYDKLPQVEEEGHFNAFFTRCLQNNIFSKTSWYYRRYVRPDRNSRDITDKERDIADGEVK